MIGVIGAGSFGTALAKILASNTNDAVFIHGKNTDQLKEIETKHSNTAYLPGVKLPKNLKVKYDIADLISNCTDILIVVPSKNFSEVVKEIAPMISKDHRIAWATKGLDFETGKFLHEIIEEIFGKERKHAVISGPSFAKEIGDELPTAVAIAANDDAFAKDLIARFHSKTFRVYGNKDIIGVQLGGIVKNIFAVACGISDGLNFGANARAALITRGLAEMIKLGRAVGAKESTLMGLSGCGDIVLSCTDNKSRNRTLGLYVGQGKDIVEAQKAIGQAVESLDNCSAVCKLGKKHNIELPIASTVEAILTGKITPEDAVLSLISRKPADED